MIYNLAVKLCLCLCHVNNLYIQTHLMLIMYKYLQM